MEMEREWKGKGNYFKRYFIGESLKYGWMEHSEPASFTSWDLSTFALHFSIPNFSIPTHMVGFTFTFTHLVRGHCMHEGKEKRSVHMLRRDQRTMQRQHTSFPSEKRRKHEKYNPSTHRSIPTIQHAKHGKERRTRGCAKNEVWLWSLTPGYDPWPYQ